MPYTKYDGTIAAETVAPANSFYGTSGADNYAGTAAPESFWGGGGDRMVGGGGDDSYFIKSTNDVVVEVAGGGVDTIIAWSNIYLSDHPAVENVRVESDKGFAAGNGLDNIVQGAAGSQQLYGGGGQDVLIGGAGADVFIVYKGEGNDVIQDFSVAQGDMVRLKAGFTSFEQVKAAMSQVGSDVKLDMGGGDALTFRNMSVNQFTASNFQLPIDASKLGAMTFHDEFSGPLSLWDKESNPTGVWRPDYGYGGVDAYSLTGNGEKQIYTSPYFKNHPGDFNESPFVSNGDGTVSIWAKASSNPEIFGYGYTSGLITTKESFNQLYGYFEMRADLPQAEGAWPAFWMLPKDGSWPPELDIMEVLSRDDNATWTTAHWGTPSNHGSNSVNNLTPDTADGFHTYGALWTAKDITWYVDGVEVFKTATPADMNKPMYLLANMAMGGWGGAVDPADFPAEMKIDYIRAYALGDGTSGGSGGGIGGPIGGSTGGSTGGGSTGGGSTGGGSTGGSTGGGLTGGGSAAVDAGQNLMASANGDTLQGGAGADTLNGGAGRDLLWGGKGADRIMGAGEFDNVNGNEGADSISGGAGDDWISGGKESDFCDGDEGADLVLGNMGDDWCDGGTGADTVRGGQGNDTLLGGDGDDWLAGDRGDDVIAGGAGADTFHAFSGSGIDRVTDFNLAQGDRVHLFAGQSYSVVQSGADTVIDLGGGDQLILANVQASTLSGSGWLVTT